MRRMSSFDIPGWTLKAYSSLSTWRTSFTAPSAIVIMKVWTPKGPSGYSHCSEPSAFFQTAAGAPNVCSSCAAGVPGAIAEKFAQPAARRLRARRAAARFGDIVSVSVPIGYGFAPGGETARGPSWQTDAPDSYSRRGAQPRAARRGDHAAQDTLRPD